MINNIPWEEITLGEKLGEGGFGIVYRGEWKHGGEVAIKKIKGVLGQDAEAEFRREAEVMAQLNSPYIIRLFGLCWAQQEYAIVMELMPNQSLFHLLHNGQPLPWSIRYNIAQDIAYGLRLLHSRDILHRDLKSLNVLLDGNLRAKLTDFGLAKVKTQSKSTSKAGGSSVGTVAWMAPELFGLKPKYANASDVYAYGMTAWELASREVPYEGVVYDEIKSAVRAGEREDIPSECPQSFAALIQSCWSSDARLRPNLDVIVESLAGLIAAEPKATALVVPVSTYQDASPSSMGLVTPALVSQVVPARPLSLVPQFEQQMKISSPPPKPVKTIPTMDAREVARFLNHVAQGEQDQAEAMLQSNPTLVLARGTIKDLAGRNFKGVDPGIAKQGHRVFEEMTAFQYALWALDSSMWRMLLKYLEQYPGAAAGQAEDARRGPWAEALGVDAGAQFQGLMRALQTYIDNWQPWSAEQCRTHWIKQVGGAQLLLPAHVLNEYCHPGRAFEPCPDFSQDGALPRSRKINIDKDYEDLLAASWNGGSLGSSFGLLRYSFAAARMERSGWAGVRRINSARGVISDRRAVTSLFSARTQQRDQLISELSNGSTVVATRRAAGLKLN
jgi:serine/threonine protein kinase